MQEELGLDDGQLRSLVAALPSCSVSTSMQRSAKRPATLLLGLEEACPL